LSAAAEVAAFRIAQEAVAKVVRHADARCCSVQLRIDNAALVIEVTDDGTIVASSRWPSWDNTR